MDPQCMHPLKFQRENFFNFEYIWVLFSFQSQWSFCWIVMSYNLDQNEAVDDLEEQSG